MVHTRRVLGVLAFYFFCSERATANKAGLQLRQHTTVSHVSTDSGPSSIGFNGRISTLSQHNVISSWQGTTSSTSPLPTTALSASTPSTAPSSSIPAATTSITSATLHSFATPIEESRTLTAATHSPSPSNIGTRVIPTPQLPLQPTITPAIAIAGVVLLLTGLFYTLIGVQARWLYIFMSAVYLGALGVTVLLVHVANLETSNTVQGAYFVTACATGLILGGLSLIFPDITEGLGRLLGGFCLAMWLLVLRPGGLVSSTGGRVAFTVSFPAAAFCLSFSRHTRDYALIGCIAFAGATVIVLGIDCFSRAGLKEFWLYIWIRSFLPVQLDWQIADTYLPHLNNNLFPPNTNTYPITRAIQFEIACIIILFCCGLLSQIKLWKRFKDHRAKNAAARVQDEEQREHVEADAGRRTEDINNKERAQWEAKYGDTKQISTSKRAGTSGFPSTYNSRSSSASIKKYPPVSVQGLSSPVSEHVEMSETGPTGWGNRVEDFSSGETKNDHAEVPFDVDADQILVTSYRTSVSQAPKETLCILDPVSETPSLDSSMKNNVRQKDITLLQPIIVAPRGSVVGARPQVVPLPFMLPTAEADYEDGRDEVASMATDSEMIHGDRVEQGQSGWISKISSIHASFTRLSRYYGRAEALAEPRSEDDRSFSVAASMHDLKRSDGALPLLIHPGSPTFEGKTTDFKAKPVLRKVRSNSDLKREQEASRLEDLSITVDARKKHRRSSSPLLSPSSQADSLENENIRRAGDISQDPVLGVINLPNGKSAFASNGKNVVSGCRSLSSDLEPQFGDIKESLPERSIKAPKTWGPYEWANHTEDADVPVDDHNSSPSSLGILTENGPRQTAAPVRMEELEQGATSAGPSPVSRNKPQNSIVNPYGRSCFARSTSNQSTISILNQPHITLRRQSSNLNDNAPHIIAPSTPRKSNHHRSALNLRHSFPQPALHTRGLRNSSTPIVSKPLIESAAEEDSEIGIEGTNSLAQIPRKTLMSRRQEILRNKPSTTSFSSPYVPSNLNTNLLHSSNSPFPRPIRTDSNADNTPLSPNDQHPIDEESMTLAQRRDYILQQRLHAQPPLLHQYYRQQPTRTSPPASKPHHHHPIYESHQPRRTSTALASHQRESRLTNWRASMSQDSKLAPWTVMADGEGRGNPMRNDARQEQLFVQQQQHQREREGVWRGGMVDERTRGGGRMFELHREGMRRMQRGARWDS